MAKRIKYKFLSAEINHGTEETPDVEQILLEKVMGWSDANMEIAKSEAYGEITVEDDGQPEPETPPNALELQAENKLLRTQLQAQTDRTDFLEDCIAEMAMLLYE